MHSYSAVHILYEYIEERVGHTLVIMREHSFHQQILKGHSHNMDKFYEDPKHFNQYFLFKFTLLAGLYILLFLLTEHSSEIPSLPLVDSSRRLSVIIFIVKVME